MQEDVKAIVIENGSGFIKAGLSGETKPRVIFQYIGGEPIIKNPIRRKTLETPDTTIIKKKSIENEQQTETEIDTKWVDMKKIWLYTIAELNVKVSDHPIFLIVSPFTSDDDRKIIADIMFKSFNVPALYIATYAVLELYYNYKTTGTVVYGGLPIYGENTISSGFKERLEQEINCLIETLIEALINPANKALNPANKALIEALIDTGNEVLIDPGNEVLIEALIKALIDPANKALINPANKALINPANQTLIRALIKQALIDPAIQALIRQALINPTNRALIKKALIDPSNIKITPQSDINQVWVAGSRLSSTKDFNQKFVLRQEYMELGPAIIHRKCF